MRYQACKLISQNFLYKQLFFVRLYWLVHKIWFNSFIGVIYCTELEISCIIYNYLYNIWKSYTLRFYGPKYFVKYRKHLKFPIQYTHKSHLRFFLSWNMLKAETEISSLTLWIMKSYDGWNQKEVLKSQAVEFTGYFISYVYISIFL